ncbi:MAG TPA: rhodanese-like domain-containing protein [Nitrospirota bacterium]|nr:rhodanese-like domain-containing protein [Nitrospirota bacterium]
MDSGHSRPPDPPQTRRDYPLRGYKNIGPEELIERMTSGEEFFLLDMRTPAEYAAQAIEGAHLIPLHYFWLDRFLAPLYYT